MNKFSNKLDLRQLRHFLSVVQTGSFSVAADTLLLTQPALSKSIRTLEQTLGVRLLDRGPNGVQATLFGEKLLGYAELMLSLAEEAVDELDAIRGARRGSLRVGAMPSCLRQLIPDVLDPFLRLRPDVRVTVHEGLNDALLPLLIAGKLDVVFTVKPAQVPDDEYEWRHVTSEPLSIIAHHSHPLAGKADLKLADLQPFQWVVPPHPEPDRLIIEAAFRAAELLKPRAITETTSLTFLFALLTRKPHLSYLTGPHLTAGQTGLVALDVREFSHHRDIYAVYRRKGELRPTVSALLSALNVAEPPPRRKLIGGL